MQQQYKHIINPGSPNIICKQLLSITKKKGTCAAFVFSVQVDCKINHEQLLQIWIVKFSKFENTNISDNISQLLESVKSGKLCKKETLVHYVMSPVIENVCNMHFT